MSEEDDLGGIGAFGIGNVLRESGIDISGFNSLFSKTGGQTSSSLAQADYEAGANDASVKYMDDEISDEDMAPDEEGERIKAARQKEEARMYRKALAMQRQMQGADAVAERKRKAEAREESAQEIQRRIWPEYERGGRVRMSEIFYETPLQRRLMAADLQKRKRQVKEKVEHRFKVAPLPTTTPQAAFLEASLPDLPLVDINAPNYARPIGQNFDPEWVKEAKEAKRKEMKQPPNGFNLESEGDQIERDVVERSLDLAEWEKDIIYDTFSQNYRPTSSTIPIPSQPQNDFLAKGDWVMDVIWDATRVRPDLVESDDEVTVDVQRTKGKKAEKQPARLDPFNISNDHLYEQPREARFRIRQTFGAIEVFHAGPAKDLQLPFYRTTLSKAEARSWRRPPIQFPIGIPITFSKLKSNPSASTVNSKKKAMVSDPSERFKSTKDLTMSEKGPYVLLEFSEEYPPIMSGYGMGTTIVNYYRKKDDKDEHVPKLDFGQPSILNVGDADPYLLGYVDRGKVTQIIHNNLIRAPIFRHTPENSDFLVIRQTVGNQVNYYIRAINNLFTVGQTTPNQSEVPGPHARKSTNTAKQRLQIIAWLLIQKSPHKNLDLPRLLRYFPEQTELQMRQRLKIKGNEFLLYSRDPGPNQGHWILNPQYNWPKDRKEVLEQCTPEMAMLYEAMQVGARHLYDAGYTKTAEGKEEEEMGADDPTGLDIEQQLAVWSTTLTYKKAEGQKAWLVVHGPGEPTGRGEGFSFLRTNMKSYFLRKGETEQGRRLEAERKADGAEVKISNSAQQVIYEEEKRKVWDLQWKALSNPVPPELAPEDEIEAAAPTPMSFLPAARFNRADSRRAQSRGASMMLESPRDRSPSVYSNDGESAFTGNVNANRVLRIKRVDKKGKETVQIVRDPAVIAQYLKRREEARLAYYAENPDRLAEILEPTGNPEEDEFRRIALRQNIEKAKKNQMRRAARKKSMKGELEVYEGDESGKRKCGACGMIGHTKANRMCPKFQASVAPSPIGGTPTVPTPGGGYGMPFTPIDVPEAAPTTSLKIRLGGVRPQ